MKEHPILFTPDNIRAILDDKKTQTRRLIKPQPTKWHMVKREPFHFDAVDMPRVWSPLSDHSEDRVCPYEIGDRLWVRERYAHFFKGNDPSACKYLADAGTPRWPQAYSKENALESWRGQWKSALFMPKWAARIWLDITDVRVQRVQEISHEDAIAENCHGYGWVSQSPYVSGPHTDDGKLPQEEYEELWDSINGKTYPWASNPWVWCLTFKRVEV